jgi:uncharacterized protein (DUF58 family)
MPRLGAGASCRRSVSEPTATPKVVAYATLTGIGLLAAVVFGNVAIVALAAPFGFALVIGLLAPVAPLPEVRLSLDASQLVEGSRATIALELSAPTAIARWDVTLNVPAGLSTQGPTGWSLRLDAGSPAVIEVPITADHYEQFSVGPATTNVPGLFGILGRSGVGGNTVELEALPKTEALRTLVRAREVRATAGDRLARQVRAASGLAAAYLARHDRVGLVAFGGVLHWVEPAMGRAQLERLVAALTATQWHPSYAWKSAETIPSRTLPSTGLVIAISPLEDARMLNALATIRARGVDLAVVERSVAVRRGPCPQPATSLPGSSSSNASECETTSRVAGFRWSDGTTKSRSRHPSTRSPLGGAGHEGVS